MRVEDPVTSRGGLNLGLALTLNQNPFLRWLLLMKTPFDAIVFKIIGKQNICVNIELPGRSPIYFIDNKENLFV